VAGEAYRLHQAGELMRSVKVVTKEATATEGPQSLRAFHALPDPEGGPGWRFEPVEEIAADPIKATLLLREMRREWEALHRRYGHMVEFIELVNGTLGESAA
jgi:hypothetical protein